jgi:hypothetical protein
VAKKKEKVEEVEVEAEAEIVEPNGPFDFEEPEVVDWEKELEEPDDETTEVEEDVAEVLGAATNNNDEAIFESAKKLGIDDESLEGFRSDPQALKKALSLLERQGMKPTPTEEPSAEEPVGDTFKASIDEESWDPDIVNQFKSLEKVTEALNAKIVTLEMALSSASHDALFQEVDDKFSDLLGTGPSSLLSDGDQLTNRSKVMEQVDLLKAGYKNLGKEVPSPDRLLNQAVKVVFTDDLEELAEKKINSKMAKRQNQKTNRPTKRTGRKLSPSKEAERSVAKLMRERGLLGSVSESFE